MTQPPAEGKGRDRGYNIARRNRLRALMLLINQVAKKVVIMCIAPDNYCVKKICHQEDIVMKQGNGYWSHHRSTVHNPVTGTSRKQVVVQEKSILSPVADMRRQKAAVKN